MGRSASVARRTPARSATARACAAARACCSVLTSGARRLAPWSSFWPASSQPMVPLRRAVMRLGRPAFTSDWVPMMLRVRPAQLTTMWVLGSGARAAARSTSSAPGTLTPLGMLMVWYSSKRRASSTTTLAWLSIRAFTSSAQRGGVALGLDQLAKGFAGYVDVAEQLTARVAPALQTAGQQRHLGVAQGLQAARRRIGQAFAVVEHHHGGVQPRDAGPGIELDAAHRQVGRPQRVGLGKGVFLAHVEQGDLASGQQVLADVGVGGGGQGSGHGVVSSCRRRGAEIQK